MSKFFKALEEADRERARRQKAQQPEADTTGLGPPQPTAQLEDPQVSLDEIKGMARGPFQLVDQFIEQARRITSEAQISPAGAMEKFRQHQERLLQQMEDLLKTFRLKVSQKEQELQAILTPAREDLAKQALKAARTLTRAIERLCLKETLTRRWMDQSASTILAEYEQALRRAEVDTLEIFDAEAEAVLERKGDQEAVATFAGLRARSLESRLTPAQKAARTALQELNRIKEETKVTLCFLASTFRAYGGLVPLGALWRKEERHGLDQVDQRIVSIAVHKDDRTPLPVTLLEFSKSGLKVQASEMFPAGRVLSLSLELPGGTEQAIFLKGEVRWCKPEPSQLGRYTLGLQLAEGLEARWPTLFPKLLNQVYELSDLFSSLSR